MTHLFLSFDLGWIGWQTAGRAEQRAQEPFAMAAKELGIELTTLQVIREDGNVDE